MRLTLGRSTKDSGGRIGLVPLPSYAILLSMLLLPHCLGVVRELIFVFSSMDLFLFLNIHFSSIYDFCQILVHTYWPFKQMGVEHGACRSRSI